MNHGVWSDHRHEKMVPTAADTASWEQERVGQFRRWLQEQPERVIVVFGHSTFLREFIGGGKHLKNCELFTLHL